MSKVVHLTADVHRRAKDFCAAHGLKMSDWVAILIADAISAGSTDTQVQTTVPKKKIVTALAATPQAHEESVPAYALPPFWARKASGAK